jgi:hypothetical protein
LEEAEARWTPCSLQMSRNGAPVYFTGDGAVRDKDGDIQILGRTDGAWQGAGERRDDRIRATSSMAWACDSLCAQERNAEIVTTSCALYTAHDAFAIALLLASQLL